MSSDKDDLLIRTQAQLIEMQSATITAQGRTISALRDRVRADAAALLRLKAETETLRKQLGLRSKGMQA